MDITHAMPYTILLDIFYALIEPEITTDNLAPVLAFSSTCKALNQMLREHQTIWHELFAAKYDLHEHHKANGFDLKQEMRLRHVALKSTRKWSEGSKLSIPLFTGCRCREETNGLFRVLVRIALENVHNNVKSLIHHRAHWHYSAFQLSYFTLRNSVVSRWRNPACQSCSDWLAFCEVVGLANTATFKMILRQRCAEDLDCDWLFLFFSANRDVSLIAQAIHLKMIYLLAHRDNGRGANIRQCYTLESMPDFAKEGSFKPSCYLSQVMSALEGHWTGYTSEDSEDPLDMSFHVKEASNEQTTFIAVGNGYTTSGIARKNGEIDFASVTIEGHQQQYLGFLLPWGIVGTANKPGFEQTKKLFWIWRISS